MDTRPEEDTGLVCPAPLETRVALGGGRTPPANVVSAAAVALVAALGRAGAALGLVTTECRPAGRCTGAGRGDGTLLRDNAARFEEG